MRAKPKKLLLLLVSLGLLTGCAQTPQPAPIAADQLCLSWRHQTISKNDKLTDNTASQIEANNKSRPAWGCVYGQNMAASKG